MSQETDTCSRCGAPMVASEAGPGTGGLCARCLLQAGLGGEDAPEVVVTGGPAPGRPPAPTVQDLAADFSELEISELIGQGGMGAVYRAVQRGLERPVALKILTADATADPSFAERFTRAARALAGLSHPNLVTVHEFGQRGPWYFLLMELVDGVTLRQMLRAERIEPRQALALIGQICDALQYAHDEGVVHRDIKPENIVVDARGRLKILDFGLAKLLADRTVEERLTLTNQAVGTPHYMAPEQWEKPLEVDHRADIYSLGVVFYELLTGELPVGRFPLPSTKVEVDVGLDEVVLKTLEKEPQMRYQKASQVKIDAESAGQQAPELPARPVSVHTASEQYVRPRKKSNAWVWILVVVLLIPCFGVFLMGFAWMLFGVRMVEEPMYHEERVGPPRVGIPVTEPRVAPPVDVPSEPVEEPILKDAEPGETILTPGEPLSPAPPDPPAPAGDGAAPLRISAETARRYAIPDDSLAQANEVLADALSLYRHIERLHSRVSWASEDELHVTVESFSDERDALMARLQADLAHVLGGAPLEAGIASELDVDGHLRYGWAVHTIVITRRPGGFHVLEHRSPNAKNEFESAGDAPHASFAHFWERGPQADGLSELTPAEDFASGPTVWLSELLQLGLDLKAIEGVSRALQEARAEYRVVEAGHTLAEESEDGSLFYNIYPFPASARRILDKLHAAVDDAVADPLHNAIVKKSIGEDPFPYGEAGVSIELSRDPQEKFFVEVRDENGALVQSVSAQSELPADLSRLWIDSSSGW